LRITHEIRKNHGWEKVIGRTSVRKILKEHGFSPVIGKKSKKQTKPSAIHAPHPNQTMNIDLFFVTKTNDPNSDQKAAEKDNSTSPEVTPPSS
jgi:hypothetical protein